MRSAPSFQKRDFAFAVDDVDGDVEIVEDAAKEIDFRERAIRKLRGKMGGASLSPIHLGMR